MYRLERACQVQLAAQATGAPLITPRHEICALSAERSDEFLATEPGRGYGSKPNPEFDAMMRLLDKKDPSYRT
jgi:hypothetical protein